MNQTPTNERRALLVLLLALGICFVYLIRPVFLAVSLASILAILLHPTYQFILKKFKNRRYAASFVTTTLAFLVLVLPLSFIIMLIINEVFQFLSTMNVRAVLSGVVSQEFYQAYIQPPLQNIEHKLNIHVDLASLLNQLGREVARYIYDFSPQVLAGTASIIFSFFIMHVTLFFLFIEGKTVLKIIMDLSPLKAQHEKRLSGEFKNMIHATVYGYLVTAFVQAILAGVGFGLAGVPAPLVFATLTFFMSLVPIVGATSVWLPMALWYFLTGDWQMGLFIALYGALLISGVDNIIKPLIMKGKAKIHILLIFFSLLGGIRVFGPVGILFGPVLVALFVACIRIYREDFLKTA